jgi:hypothetical protein
MTNERLWASSSRKLAILLVVAAPPAATLVWLGLRLLQQDRSLDAKIAISSSPRPTVEVMPAWEWLVSDARARGLRNWSLS